MSDEKPQHPAVPHPAHLLLREDLTRYERRFWGRVAVGNDWLATHLAWVFGLAWTIWVFFIWPLVVELFPVAVQNKTFYYASGWVQLFALPLMIYVGNKLQRSSDAQSAAMYQALTHIATVSDQNKMLIEANTELTQQVHDLTRAVHDRLPSMEAADGFLAGRPDGAGPGVSVGDGAGPGGESLAAPQAHEPLGP